MAYTDLIGRFSGCLLGGAVGNALGAAVQFASLETIHMRYGPAGITGYEEIYGRRGAISEDTQLTLFTAEALIRTATARQHGESAEITPALHRAYLRWLHTQGRRSAHQAYDDALDGWLIRTPALHSQRSPGRGCISALCLPHVGTMHHPINDSSDPGALTRVAPVGLWAEHPFEVGCQSSALTHGGHSACIAAGVFAVLIERLAAGVALVDAVPFALEHFAAVLPADVAGPLTAAKATAAAAPGSTEALTHLGTGWAATEALAIAVYCALSAQSFDHGVLLAVNHGGDSNSTGTLTGQLLGTAFGVGAIDGRWLEPLELRAEIASIAEDLLRARLGEPVEFAQYPPG